MDRRVEFMFAFIAVLLSFLVIYNKKYRSLGWALLFLYPIIGFVFLDSDCHAEGLDTILTIDLEISDDSSPPPVRPDFGIEEAGRALAGENGGEVFYGEADHFHAGGLAGAADVRREHHVVQGEETGIQFGFAFIDIKSRRGNFPGLQGFD